jgi:hypothetical protein
MRSAPDRGSSISRGEYAYLWDALQDVLRTRRDLGLLGANILGRQGFDFDIRIQLGARAYICGEESSLIESLEGKRGSLRDRPPFPTERGYLGQPSAVDNVETYVCAARIMEKGAPWFAGLGTKESTGTKLMSVSGDCARPGVYEAPFGIAVNELLDMVGAPDAEYVQMSGPSGQAVAPKDFGRRIAYEDLSTGGSTMIFGPGRDVLDIALQFADFFVEESCGYCTPCRVGTTLLKHGMEKIIAGRATLADLRQMEALGDAVVRMSRCGLGQTAPNPILTTMRSFPELYEARLAATLFTPLEAGEVEQARFHIVEFRGFERFIQGRMFWEVPVIVQRLFGICPVSHHLGAGKAMDIVAGVDQLTPTAEKMRRLMHYGQVLQSNALNFFHLASPDLLLGFEAPVAQRNIIGVIEAFPEVGKWAIFIRKFGQRAIAATGGKAYPPAPVHSGRRQPESDDRAPRCAPQHRPDHPVVRRGPGAA